MEQGKDLLLRDLCERLPYGVKVNIEGVESEPLGCKVISVNVAAGTINVELIPADIEVALVKPYLRPMSSMTKEEEYEYHQCKNIDYLEICEMEHTEMLKANALCFSRATEWLNKKGFDYRGLIPMGLALEAPEEMYKTE